MFAILLKGHHPDMALEEVKTLCKTYGSKVIRTDRRICVIEKEIRFERLAYSHLAIKVIASGDVKNILEKVGNVEVDGTFAVRGPMNLSVKIGARIRGKVNLTNPETEFYVLSGEKLYFGEKIWEQDKKGLQLRFSRVYYHPTNLKPELARALVNLTGVKEGEKLLDPFCGAGSILIEAADMGIIPTGIDIDEKMVEGCKENLEFLGYEADVIHGDAFELVGRYKKRFQGIATDIPYGRSSTLSGRKKDEFLEKLPEIFDYVDEGKIVIMSDKSLLLPGKINEFKIKVHGSLTRYVNIFEK